MRAIRYVQHSRGSVRFPEVLQVSVRSDLLRDDGYDLLRDTSEVDRVAAEVSAMLLGAGGGGGGA